MVQKKKEPKKKAKKEPEKAPAKARPKRGRPKKEIPQDQPQSSASGGSIVGGGQPNASQGAAPAHNPQPTQSAVPSPVAAPPAQSQQMLTQASQPQYSQPQYPQPQIQMQQPFYQMPQLAPIPGPAPSSNSVFSAPSNSPISISGSDINTTNDNQNDNAGSIRRSGVSTGSAQPVPAPVPVDRNRRRRSATPKHQILNARPRASFDPEGYAYKSYSRRSRSCRDYSRRSPQRRVRSNSRSRSDLSSSSSCQPKRRRRTPRSSRFRHPVDLTRPVPSQILSPPYQSAQSNPIQQSSVQSSLNSSVADQLPSQTSASIPKPTQKLSDSPDSEKASCAEQMARAFSAVGKLETNEARQLLAQIEKRIKEHEPPEIGHSLDAVAHEARLRSFEEMGPSTVSNENIQKEFNKHCGAEFLLVDNQGLNDCVFETLLYCFEIAASPEAIRLLRLVLAEVVRENFPDTTPDLLARIQTPGQPVPFQCIFVMMKCANACFVVLRVENAKLAKSTYDPSNHKWKDIAEFNSWDAPNPEPTRMHVLFIQLGSKWLHHVFNCEYLRRVGFILTQVVASAGQVSKQSFQDRALFQETHAEFETAVSTEKIGYFAKIEAMKKANDLEGLKNLSDEIERRLEQLDTLSASEKQSQENKSDGLKKTLKKQHAQAGAQAIEGFGQLAENMWIADRKTRIKHCVEVQTRKRFFQGELNDVRVELGAASISAAAGIFASFAPGSSNASNITGDASPIFKPKQKANRQKRKLKSQIDRKPDGFSQNSISWPDPEPETSQIQLSTKRERDLSPEKSLKRHKLAESSDKSRAVLSPKKLSTSASHRNRKFKSSIEPKKSQSGGFSEKMSTKRDRDQSRSEKRSKKQKPAESSDESLVVLRPKKPSRKQIRKLSEDPTSGDESFAIGAVPSGNRIVIRKLWVLMRRHNREIQRPKMSLAERFRSEDPLSNEIEVDCTRSIEFGQRRRFRQLEITDDSRSSRRIERAEKAAAASSGDTTAATKSRS